MILLGIDPGIGRTGWGVINKNGAKTSLIAYGCIETKAHSPLESRLPILFDELTAIISTHKPDSAALETLFFNTNAKTAMIVGQARGVAVLALARAHITQTEFTPLQVKQAVTGYGAAPKQQVQQMVKTLLNLDTIPQPDDAADALAVALALSATRLR